MSDFHGVIISITHIKLFRKMTIFQRGHLHVGYTLRREPQHCAHGEARLVCGRAALYRLHTELGKLGLPVLSWPFLVSLENSSVVAARLDKTSRALGEMCGDVGLWVDGGGVLMSQEKKKFDVVCCSR